MAFERPRWFGMRTWDEICQAKLRWLTTDSSEQSVWPLTPVLNKLMPVFYKSGELYKHCAGNVQVIPWYLNMAYGERAPSERVLVMEILFEAQVSPAIDRARLAYLVSLTDQHLRHFPGLVEDEIKHISPKPGKCWSPPWRTSPGLAAWDVT